LLSQLGATQEKKSRNAEKLKGAASGILAELETNLGLAKQPISKSMSPFVKSNWETYKGEAIKLQER